MSIEKINTDNNLIIDAQEISVIFDKNIILSDVSFSMKKGELVYLIGKTGSGKTSFIRLLYADIKPSAGNISAIGYDINKIKRKQIQNLRRKLGMIFQDFQLLTDRTVYENFFFAMRATGWKGKDKIIKRANEVLTMVGVPEDKGNSMPHQLSGGEQQRIVFARALINEPELIIADEPTGNLDPETSSDVMKVLVEMNKKGISVLMATHNYNLIGKYPSKTFLCENSKITEVKNTVKENH